MRCGCGLEGPLELAVVDYKRSLRLVQPLFDRPHGRVHQRQDRDAELRRHPDPRGGPGQLEHHLDKAPGGQGLGAWDMADTRTCGPKKSEARPMMARTVPRSCAASSASASWARTRPFGPVAR